MTTLHLMCGLPGAGKTTLAKQIEAETGAIRLCPDEWIEKILIDPADREEMNRLRDIIERMQWELAQQLLAQQTSVILESGFWSKEERTRYRDIGRRLGAQVKLHYLDVPHEELWARVEKRNNNLPAGSFSISKEELYTCFEMIQKPDAAEIATFD